MRYLVLLGLLLVSAVTTAEEERHMTLALQFDSLISGNKDILTDALVREAIKSDPSFESHKEQLRLFLVNVLESEEYKNEKARAYMRIFSEDELVQLVAMAEGQAYKLLKEKQNGMVLAVMLSTMTVISKKLPEFQKSIGDVGRK
jgi:Glu-tRNA(Gln) amidotransferase subunit E-like FAD-binding protein